MTFDSTQLKTVPAIRAERIRVAGPSITEHEVAYVADAARNAWDANAGMYHERFERAFADYIGVRHAVSLPSCTAALHLSLAALGVGPGDEVIVPDVTWIASAAPVDYLGATPIFADIDPVTWCLDAASVERLVSPRTKAIVTVDLYGSVGDWDALRAVAERHGIPIVEDSAEALGSEWKGRRAGALGLFGTFSFHGSKTLTTGEGGMLVTDDDRLHDRVQVLRDHGRPKGDTLFYNTEIAYKYKMSSMQAAMGLAQLERVDEILAIKRRVFGWYRDRLAGRPGLSINAEPPGSSNSFWMNTVVFDPELGVDKRALARDLAARQIDTRPFFFPLSSLPAYARHADQPRAAAENRNAYRVSPHGINLPSGAQLTEEMVDYVCAHLLDAAARLSRG